MTPIARRRRCVFATVVVLAAASLVGCSDATDSVVRPLQGSWVLQSGADADGDFIEAARPVTLEVEGRDYLGSSPCNTYSGTLAARGGELDLGEGGIASTEMACADPEQMALEGRYYAALVAVERAESTGDELVLTGPGIELVYSAAG